MKTLVAVFMLVGISCASCRTQLSGQKRSIQIVQTKNQDRIGVKGSDYKGTIFTREYQIKNLFWLNTDSTQMFTPSLEEVKLAENLLHHQLKAANKQRPNQQPGNPILHRNLPKYFRQYIGFKDKSGNRIVHINFHWNRYNLLDKLNNYIYFNDSRLDYESDYSVVMDGGSYYWQINANITKMELTDLGVNGFG